MVDLSKHLAKAKQAIERRNYDMAIELTVECHELDPTNLDNLSLLIDASKRRARESGKKGGFMPTLSLTKDPYKQLAAAVKRVSKNPDIKALLAAGEAAHKVYQTGVKGMIDASILFYREGQATGLHNPDLLWNLAHAHMDRFNDTKDFDSLDAAISTLSEFEMSCKGHKLYPDATRKARAWEAIRAREQRPGRGAQADYQANIADSDQAKKQEAMNKIIRTADDARQVLAYCDEDLARNPQDKHLWIKRGDIMRRLEDFDGARESYLKAQEVDAHDFVVTMRLGDLEVQILRHAIEQAKAAGQDPAPLQEQLTDLEIAEYRKRIERQPTEMGHHFNLAQRLFKRGDIDGAASEFQQALKDPRFKRDAHRYLGHCFAKKNLLDLSRDQFTSCLSLIEDPMSEGFKDTLYHRARVHEAMGNKDDAAADYTKVVEIDLGYKDAAQRLNACRGS
ncbi:MAG: hypothetical protein ACOCYP_03930 [Planctomycetota bacterium]